MWWPGEMKNKTRKRDQSTKSKKKIQQLKNTAHEYNLGNVAKWTSVF